MSLKLPVLKRLGANPTPVAIAQEVERLRTWFEGVRVAGGFQSNIDILGVISEAIGGIEFPPEYTPPVFDTPTVPTDLVATGLFGKIMLQWAWVNYNGHSRTEIWRAQVDDLGQAVKVGDAWTPDVLFVDSSLPNSSLGATYFYWARLVNKNDLAGAFNGVAGTPGRTADDPDYLIELATESKWKPNHNYALGDLTMPRVPNNYVYEVTVDGGSSSGAEPVWPVVINDTVVDGGLTWKCKSELSIESFFAIALVGGVAKLTLREIFIADQVVSRAKIKDLAVNDAKIENLSVAKLIAGVIQASNIFLGAESRVHLDGQNNRLVVTDSNDVTRVVLGKLAVGYGIEIYDAGGQMILGSGGQYGGAIANSAVPVGGNELGNVFNAPVWTGWNFVNVTGQSSISFDLVNWGVNPSPPHTGYIGQTGVSQAEDYLGSPGNPVVPGESYGFSLYSGAHRALCRIWINWFNSAGVWIGATTASVNDSEASGGTSLSGYKRLFSYGVAPAGAVHAQLVIVKGGTKSSTNSYFFFTRPQFGRINAGQTVPPMWTPGAQIAGQGDLAVQDTVDWVTQVGGKTWWAALGGQLSAVNISTYIQAAAIELLLADRVYVNTLNILGNAVTVPFSIFNPNGTELTWMAETTLEEIAITVANIPYTLLAEFAVYRHGGQNSSEGVDGVSLRLYFNSTLIASETYPRLVLVPVGYLDGQPDYDYSGEVTHRVFNKQFSYTPTTTGTFRLVAHMAWRYQGARNRFFSAFGARR